MWTRTFEPQRCRYYRFVGIFLFNVAFIKYFKLLNLNRDQACLLFWVRLETGAMRR